MRHRIAIYIYIYMPNRSSITSNISFCRLSFASGLFSFTWIIIGLWLGWWCKMGVNVDFLVFQRAALHIAPWYWDPLPNQRMALD
ncbi:hypothetical protein VNO77_09548 [Canavalia gladiata]|uniref:Uncharacterized protein n=1 Tax=Canavalia gladiata TaxID=3824 RepID=A0AAN9MES3_CANGL